MPSSIRLSDLKLQPVEPRATDRRQAAEGSRVLWARAAAVRRRLILQAVGEGVLWVLGFVVVALGIGMLGDWWWGWPRPARIVAAGVYLVIAAGVAWRYVRKPVRAVPHRDDLALLIERRRPELRSRFISAIQLGRTDVDTPEAAEFIRRLVDDAMGASADLDYGQLAPMDSLKRCARRVLPVVAVATGLFLASLPSSWILLRRASLQEVPRPQKTRLVDVTGARVVGRGDDLPIFAVVEGVIPNAGRLLIRHGSGRQQVVTLDPDPGRSGRFERVLANLPGSFRYRVRLNDAESAEFLVEVLPRPAVTNVTFTQELPAYTGRAPRPLAPGELSLLQGSILRVAAQVSQPLQVAAVRLEGVDETVEATIEAGDGLRFDARILIGDPRLTGFSFDLTDRKGIASRDSATYAVEVVPDRPPQVRMILPARREELVTSRGTVLISFEARDDFGIATLQLRHQPAGSTNASPAVVDLDLVEAGEDTARRRFEWQLSTLNPPAVEGAFIEFWVEAADRNKDEQGRPGIGRSERYLLRVVSEAEKRSDLLTRAGDAIGRLGDVAQGQERLNESLGRIILAKPPSR